jgi:geranylgeranyl diphosphate synthase type I
LAFQLVDDLLAMWGEPATTGKPVLSDLRARKKSAPIACALETRGPAVERLRAYLASTGPVDDQTLRELAPVVEAAGRRRVEDEAARQLAAAEQTLADLALPPVADAQLRTLARYITRRDR